MNSPALLTTGEAQMHKLQDKIPDGTIIGARGPHSVFAPDNELNRWFKNAYEKRQVRACRRSMPPITWCRRSSARRRRHDKAKAAANGKDPGTGTRSSRRFQGLSFETPSGTTRMARSARGTKGIQGTAYGTTKLVESKLTITNVTRYSGRAGQSTRGRREARYSGIGKPGFAR